MVKIYDAITGIDQFGYNVNLSRKGEPYKTFMGGLMTLFMNLCFLVVFLNNIDKMVSFGSMMTN